MFIGFFVNFACFSIKWRIVQMLAFIRQYRFILLTMALTIIVLSSCHGGVDTPSEKGKVDLSLSSSLEIEVKSEDAGSMLDDYHFRFAGVDDYGSSEYYRYGDVVMPMEWYFGLYKLEAESCTKEMAENGYGCLRYAGQSSTFAVINGEVTSVSVICHVNNFRVNVKFDDTMYESFDDFRLEVKSLYAPEEEGDEDDSGDPQSLNLNMEAIRTLELDPINQEGYYNLHDKPINIYYTLYVKNFDAVGYIESVSGYFEENGEPAVVSPADNITFNVKYVGAPVISPDIKFIVNGVRTRIANGVTLKDYTEGSITEDN